MINGRFSSWPKYSAEELEAVQLVLESGRVNYWTGGECREFEMEFASWVSVDHAVALANGTVALDVALKALGVGPGDDVLVTPRTFIASISSIVNAGARPVFVDVDKDSGNISADAIERSLTERTRAVICVHLGGWPCDMDPIISLAGRYGFKVIEDCAQAHGARYKGRPVGGIGDIGAWSFCQDKIMTTGGEGGMVTTGNKALWRAMWSYKDHGKSFEAIYERDHPAGFRWVHDSFGTNWRMMEIQAVIGRIQLKRMSEWTSTRTRYAERIRNTCRNFPALRVPEVGCNSCVRPCQGESQTQGCVHANYKCYVYVRPERLKVGWTRDRIVDEINSLGVPCFQGSCSEVYLEKAFDDTGWRPSARLPIARELGETSLMFLVHPTLTDSEIEMTCDVIESVMVKATM
jgi:dTDP-4-amino-4,6-dideoxygalactose transaminase